MRTSLCDLLKIEVPIVQAPIGNATSPALAAAVSNAGGLGMLAMTWRDGQTIRRMIRETRSRTTRPFGVNLVLEWDVREKLQICLQEGVRIVSLFWGNPIPYIEMARRAGALVIYSAGTVSEARRAANMGADVIVAQGWESGGHVRGDIATMVLVPRVVDAIPNKPVLASGGIADGRGIAAALALGAAGVWIGTRFLATEEAAIHPFYKRRLLEATEADTVYATLFDIGWHNAPHRMVKNSSTEMWRGAGSPPRGRRPNEGEIVAQNADGTPILRYSDVIPLPNTRGNVEALPLYAGQSVGLITRVQSARVIVRQLMEETRQALARLSALDDPQANAATPWPDPIRANPGGHSTASVFPSAESPDVFNTYAPDDVETESENKSLSESPAANSTSELQLDSASSSNGSATTPVAYSYKPDLKEKPTALLDAPSRNGGSAEPVKPHSHSTRFSPPPDEIVSVSRDSLIHRVILPVDSAARAAEAAVREENEAAIANAVVDTPVETPPTVFDKLRLTPVLMAARVNNLPRTTLLRRPGEERSIQEHVGYLLDLTALSYNMLTDAAASKPISLSEESIRPLFSTTHHTITISQLLSRFHVERARLVRELEARENNGLTVRAQHPRWRTPIRAVDLAAYLAECDEQHLTQISQILRQGNG